MGHAIWLDRIIEPCYIQCNRGTHLPVLYLTLLALHLRQGLFVYDCGPTGNVIYLLTRRKQMEGLTEKQEAVYQYIKVFIESNGWPPSMAEIGQHFAISLSVVKDTYLSALERKGYIQTISGKARAIRILK